MFCGCMVKKNIYCISIKGVGDNVARGPIRNTNEHVYPQKAKTKILVIRQQGNNT